MIVRKAALALAALSVLSLGGCISLLPKTKPVQLYRFGAAPSVLEAPPEGDRRFNISRATTSFNRAALGDRILTVSGTETAYIAETRWVSPAVVLFDEALTKTFDTAPGCTRLLTRGDPAVPDALMRVEVRNFEVRYLQGAKSAPTAVVDVRVSLIATKDRTVIADRSLRAEQLAADNRVGAIVDAIDAATVKVLGEIAAVANAEAASMGCGGNAPVTRTTTTTTTVRPR